ncbi:unnamed protein product [Rotaria sp. Silwood1]|nr:unnamed protein product [Rotaria sp. Silwood1]CAF5026744.1 unnamed protein product [Rotaria sp. Silwood1]
MILQSNQVHLNKNTTENVDCELVQNILNQVKNVFSSVRYSHQQQKLSQILQTYSETRFGARRIKNAWHITDHYRLSTILHPQLKKF